MGRGKREMEKRTYISDTLYAVSNKARYDAEVKKLLSDKTILAWIMKFSVEEFKNFSIEEIRECIEGEPEVAQVKVRPGHTPEAISGNRTDDKVPGEGEVTYDIRFYAITPDKEHVKIIINIEAQKKYHVGYDLVTRAIFYCARMLSAQLDTEFTTESYDDIKKVYSIWICMDVPVYAQNTITEYRMTENKVYGNFNGKARYDLLSVVMICLGRESANGNELIEMLNTLLSESMSVEKKESLLTDKFGIETSVKVREGISNMCNLSERIEEKGIEKGIEQLLAMQICKKLQKGKEIKRIAEELEIEEIRVKRIIETIEKITPEYDVEKILNFDKIFLKRL